MGYDLVGELRQLSHDLIAVPLDAAVKGKHPAILDKAAQEIVLLREKVQQLQDDVDKMMPLVEAVGACSVDEVPNTVYHAWCQTSGYTHEPGTLIFSQRKKLGKELDDWYDANPNVSRCIENTLAALQALGYRIERV